MTGDENASVFQVSGFIRDVRKGNTKDFFNRMDVLLANVPYEIKLDYEVHFQNFIYLLFTLMGFYTSAEYHTSTGRADVVIKTDKYILLWNSNAMAVPKRQ